MKTASDVVGSGRGSGRFSAGSIVLVVAFATIVAACSAGGSRSNVGAGTTTAGSVGAATTTTAGGTAVATTAQKPTGPTTTVAGASPVESALGLDKKSLQRRQLKVEAIVATCMKKQGFDYVPLDPTTLLIGQQGQFELPGLTEDEFRKQYGFGISTGYGVKTAPGSAPSTNPNTKIRDGLSRADQAAYDKTLSGASADGTFASAISQGDFGRLGGCYKTATIQVFGGADVLTVLTSALDDLDKRVSSDPHMVKADKDYQACLAKAGFTLGNGDAIDKYLNDKLKAIVGSTPGKANYDKAALAALQQEELHLADVEFQCDLKYRQPVETRVRAEVEKAFLDANRGLAAKMNG